MVLLTSRLSHFTATPLCFPREVVHTKGCPFSRSYGAILPSSLTMDHPITLVFSTCLPVSVCGTVTLLSRLRMARGFSRQHGLNSVALSRRRKLPFSSRLCFTARDGFAYPSAYHLRRSHGSRSLASCVPPLLYLPKEKRCRVVQEYQPVVHRLRPSATP
jgi:hypothetical protein